MGLRTHLVVVFFSLLLSLWADADAAAAETRQSSAQAVKHRPLMSRRALRHRQDITYIASSAETSHEEQALPVRVYQLQYVSGADAQAMIGPLLSDMGHIDVSSPRAVGSIPSPADDLANGGGANAKVGATPTAGGDLLVVQDHEAVLKKIDHVVKKSDVPPTQVLIEAMIIRVKLKADASATDQSIINKAGEKLAVMGDGAAAHTAAGFNQASNLDNNGKPVDATATDAGNLQLRSIQGNSIKFVRALESLGETTVLAAPRLLVLNKQRAEIHLGDRLAYRTKTANQADDLHYLDIGTKLQVRPSVSADGTTRLEIHAERSTGHLDDNGVPQTNTRAVTVNVMIPDGATVAMGGPFQATPASNHLSILEWLPYVGWLFRNTDNVATKEQLIVLITSRVWSPDGAAVACSNSKIVQ